MIGQVFARGRVVLALVLACMGVLSGCGKKAEEIPAVGAEFPQLPWPLPTPTSRHLLPRGLVTTGAGDTLGRVFDRLTQACSSADLEWSAYAIGNDGFAIVSELDSIARDGTPLRGSDSVRGGVRVESRDNLFVAILRRLFQAQPGRYRMIVFAVTGRVIDFKADTLSRSEATELLAGGELYLPEELSRARLGPNGRCEALVYEFLRPSEVDTAAAVGFGASPIRAVAHLVRSGLWREKELRP